jgi:hypothetical protein
MHNSRTFKTIVLFGILALSLLPGFFHNEELCQGFLPKNNLYIPAGLFASGGISQEQFNLIMDRLERIYSPEIASFGEEFKINRLWNDGRVNASATRTGHTRVLNMYGGLARHPSIGVEGMALVACHEIGHHLGGFPTKQDGDWGTSEGGADYYATLKCLRRFFSEDDNSVSVTNINIDPTVKASCETQFADKKDQLICLRISAAGHQAAELFQVLSREIKVPKYDTPDTSEVPKTIRFGYPSTQCRLDTYLAGMLCAAPTTDTLSATDYKQGSCYTPRDSVGYRPRCWFAPE